MAARKGGIHVREDTFTFAVAMHLNKLPWGKFARETTLDKSVFQASHLQIASTQCLLFWRIFSMPEQLYDVCMDSDSKEECCELEEERFEAESDSAEELCASDSDASVDVALLSNLFSPGTSYVYCLCIVVSFFPVCMVLFVDKFKKESKKEMFHVHTIKQAYLKEQSSYF